jgi:predicted NAD/FAD-binding protein
MDWYVHDETPRPTVLSADERRPSVAVVGAGVAGLTSAYLLRRTHSVVLFEADERLGGHAHTHRLTDSQDRPQAVDSGFIVHNDATYPLLRRLFGELVVEVRPTEMSMSITCDECGLEYAGGRGPRGVLADPRRLADPRFVRLLGQVVRFHRRAAAFLRESPYDDTTTFGLFLARQGFDEYFVAHYAMPVVSCVWSAGRADALSYPARYLFKFLDNHGMLRLTGSPRWFTVVGGSQTYVDRLAGHLQDIRVSRRVTDIRRRQHGVDIRDASGRVTTVDKVVIATHADQALALLGDPTDAEVTTLKAFEYSTNETVLHGDASLLPANARARASWNYRLTGCRRVDQPAMVTYWMNRLQGLETDDDFLVTLNDTGRIDRSTVIEAMTYEHPIYTPESLRAQQRLQSLATDRTVYAGAYHGWGFHEDGCRSGVEAARHFGVEW